MAVRAGSQQRSLAGVVEQGRHLADFLVSLRPAEFSRLLHGSSEAVGDVTAHLLLTQNQLLDAIERPTTERPRPLAEVLGGLRLAQHHRDELAADMAEYERGPALATQFHERMQQIAHELQRADLPDVVSTPAPLRMTDLVRMIAVEWVLRSDDLSRAVPGHRSISRHRGAVGDAVRTLADTLRLRHPGQAVEVRVPPYVAVQCGSADGPRHTRGTPPTVVECEPIHFIRLCRGRESFADAVRQGHVRASGVRADIAEWLPLY